MLQHKIELIDEMTVGEVVGSTVLQNVEPMIHNMARVQIAVSPEQELLLLVLKKLQNTENQLSAYANNIDYLESRVFNMQEKENKLAKLTEVLYDTNERLKAKDTVLKNLPQWHSVSDIAEAKGLSADAVRKQLENGEFEDGVDFKKPKGKILIHQGAVERIHRRRSSNG